MVWVHFNVFLEEEGERKGTVFKEGYWLFFDITCYFMSGGVCLSFKASPSLSLSLLVVVVRIGDICKDEQILIWVEFSLSFLLYNWCNGGCGSLVY